MFGLAAEFGDDELHLLAEHAFCHLRRDLPDEVIALVEVLDCELHPLELVLALDGVSARARHRGADRDRVALRPGRPGAERRLIVRIGPADLANERRHQGCARDASPELQQATARKTAGRFASEIEFRHFFLPWIPGSANDPNGRCTPAAQAKPQANAGARGILQPSECRLSSTDNGGVNATFVRKAAMRSTTLFALGRAEHDAVPLHFRLLELCCGNRPVESGAQLLGRLQGQLDPRGVPIWAPRPNRATPYTGHGIRSKSACNRRAVDRELSHEQGIQLKLRGVAK